MYESYNDDIISCDIQTYYKQMGIFILVLNAVNNIQNM
jgi:hypothetical protein